MHMIINNYINYTSILAVRNTTKRMQSKSNTGPLRIDLTSSMKFINNCTFSFLLVILSFEIYIFIININTH